MRVCDQKEVIAYGKKCEKSLSRIALQKRSRHNTIVHLDFFSINMSSSTSDRPPSFTLHFLAGGIGGTVGAAILCPLEVAKTRLQVRSL